MGEYWVIENDHIRQENLDILNEYLLALKLANKSKNTIKSYRSLLEIFFAKVDRPLVELVSDDILQWVNSIINNVKESTVLGYISILSSFFKFCLMEEYITKVLIKSRWRPRLPKPLPKYLDRSELARVRLQVENQSLRNRSIFEFLVTSGCRVSEAKSLNVEDIDLENRTVKVLGKGKKYRHVHFSETCGILLEKYIENHPKGEGALFLSRQNQRLSISSIQRFVKLVGDNAELPKSISPHCLRHTFATNLLSKGAQIEFISDEMGHSDLKTTSIYTRLPKEEILSLYRKYMG